MNVQELLERGNKIAQSLEVGLSNFQKYVDAQGDGKKELILKLVDVMMDNYQIKQNARKIRHCLEIAEEFLSEEQHDEYVEMCKEKGVWVADL